MRIYKLELLKFYIPYIEFYLKCSKGTYVRSFAEEIARRLGCVGHISGIRRLAIGPYALTQAKQPEEVSEDDVLPL